MALTEKQYMQIKEELDSCKKPLIFFHDDPDGLCSFLLLYRYKGDGKGIVIKTSPVIDSKFLRKVREYGPDKIFVVDIAQVEQEFIDEAGVPIVWIDHHGPYDRDRIRYFNPRNEKQDDNQPASYLCYNAIKECRENDLWIALTGIVGDMYWPKDLVPKLRDKYPGLIPEEVNEPRKAMFGTELGKLMRIFSFVLKGTTTDAMKYVKILTRIKSPDEILSQTTPQGNFIFKRYSSINSEYESLVKSARKKAGKSEVLMFLYPENRMSFTGDLANELAYLYPDKVILIGREKSGEIKCSLRSDRYNIPKALEKAFAGLNAHGGGHEHAAGAVIRQGDFKEFLKRLKKELKDQDAELGKKALE